MALGGLLDKAKGLLKGHGAQADQGINKAEDVAKQKVQGHDSEIDSAANQARNYVERND